MSEEKKQEKKGGFWANLLGRGSSTAGRAGENRHNIKVAMAKRDRRSE